MRPGKFARLIGVSARRNLSALWLAGAGIVVGVTMLTVFLALAAGARRVLLGEVFPIDRIEIVAPRASSGAGLFSRRTILDDTTVKQLREHPNARAVFPRLLLAFPARGWGGAALLGKDFQFEVSGFVDGIDPGLLEEELRADFPNTGHNAADDQQPIPVVVSKHLVEIYNGSIATAHGWPRIRDWMTSRFRGLTFSVELGRSFLGDTAKSGTPRVVKFRLVGVSDRAMTVGMTVPIGYVRRWNAEFADPRKALEYSSIVVRVDDQRGVTPLVTFARSLGLDQAEREAERVGLLITLASVLLALVAAIVLAMAALSIAHTYLVLISERRRELGIMRAVGASSGDVFALVLTEAAALGAIAGAVGVALAFGIACVGDWAARRFLPDFPFKPDSFFDFSPSLVAGAVGFAVICSALGAWWPARRAARMDAAQALTS